MIQHKDDYIYSENTMVEYISAEEQTWDKETLEELWDRYNICFDGKSIMPIKIINKDLENPMIVLGSEDDGTIYFERCCYGKPEDWIEDEYKNMFSAYWIDSVIEQLQEVKRRLKSEN